MAVGPGDASPLHMNATTVSGLRSSAILSAILAIAVSTTGCAAIGSIFKAGAWTGVVIALVLFALIGGVFAAFRRR
jgi:hypothetical protein